MTNLILNIAAGILIIFAVMPLIRKDEWYIRIFDFPRQQIAVLGSLVLAGYALLDALWTVDYFFITVLGISVILEIFRIAPYTFLWKKQVLRYQGEGRDNRIRIVTANVLMTNKNHQKLLNIINDKDPDVILLLETDKNWEDSLEPLEEKYVFKIKCPRDNTYGIHLYSKLKLKESDVQYLTSDEIPSIYTQMELKNGRLIYLYGLHPKPPAPQEEETTTERDAELLMVGKTISKKKAPAIVIGDLNDVAWSYTTSLFQKVSGTLDPRRGRGFFNTYNAKYPLLRWPLDHVFHTNHFMLVGLERLPYFGSDHFPMYIELAYEPKAPEVQEKPKPDNGDKKLANEKILNAVI